MTLIINWARWLTKAFAASSCLCCKLLSKQDIFLWRWSFIVDLILNILLGGTLQPASDRFFVLYKYDYEVNSHFVIWI